jgi:glycosyltransferase involved in cell wall biosynthesis
VTAREKPTALVVPSWWGQLSCDELERLARLDERPRTLYVELADRIDAQVIDSHHLRHRAAPLARLVARRVGVVEGQLAEVFLRRRRYGHILAWADRLGLPLALLFKLARSRSDLVLVSVWLSRPKKAVFLSRFKVHSHLRAIVNCCIAQMSIADQRLGVPRGKLHHLQPPVDERFWTPRNHSVDGLISSVGVEARDYATFVEAMRGLDLRAEVAVGSLVRLPSGAALHPSASAEHALADPELPANVHVRSELKYPELRSLYARSQFVVVPLEDVEFDAGATASMEAMAMGKAVIVTRTRGYVGILEDGVQGIFVAPHDPRALRNAIEHLHDRPDEAARMGRAGRELVERRFRVDDYIDRLAQLVQGENAPRSSAY